MSPKGKVGNPGRNKNRARRPSGPAAPTIVNRKVPIRRPHADYRSREYLSEKEVARVIAAAGTQGRHRLRDATLILIAYRHGLRVSELVSLRWDQIDLAPGLVYGVDPTLTLVANSLNH
jgi:integrase